MEPTKPEPVPLPLDGCEAIITRSEDGWWCCEQRRIGFIRPLVQQIRGLTRADAIAANNAAVNVLRGEA